MTICHLQISPQRDQREQIVKLLGKKGSKKRFNEFVEKKSVAIDICESLTIHEIAIFYIQFMTDRNLVVYF